tara:strand:- start:1057 stop:2151 length:1095 start_codon:yes stop_codon:yes gene_type:complete
MKPLTYDEFCKLEVNHIAHDAQRNNSVENLEIITKQANMQHAKNNPNRKSNAKARSKPILGKRKCEDTWTEFSSGEDAARILSNQEGKAFYGGCITAVCRKKNKSHQGFEFQYKTQPDLEDEVWKVNPFFNIKCSNMGRVETRTCIKTFGSTHGKYMVLGIRGKNYLVHRVVAQAFHWDVVKELYHASDFTGDIMAFWKTLHVDHVNFIKDDNRACNVIPTLPSVNSARQPPTKKSSAGAKSKKIEGRKLGELNWVTYPSTMEAARVLRLNQGGISAVCRGKRKRAGNYTFRFIKDEDLQGEIWKPIPEALFPGKKVKGMMASNLGRILTRKGVKTYGSPSEKYLRCCGLFVQRLVAAAWLCGY